MDERRQELIEERTTSGSSLIRWGPVLAGAVIGLAMAIMASALWFALAFDRGTRAFRDYLDWWVAGTAIGATLLGAFIAGLASARRGLLGGLLQGLTLWGVLVIALVALAIPTSAAFGTSFDVTVNGTRYTVTTTSYWSVFWTLVIGFGAGAVGGMLGGAIPRRERRTRTVAQPPSPYVADVATEERVPMPPPIALDDARPVATEAERVETPEDDLTTSDRERRRTR